MKLSALIFAAFLGLAGAPPSAMAQSLNEVRSQAQKAVADGQASQARINQLDDETDGLTRDYRAALKQVQALRDYNDQLDKLIVAQKAEAISLRRQIDGVTNIDRNITPLMFSMIDALEQFIALDVPFLADERRARVQNLRALMDRADTNPAEKYRKILEAYEIENEYGRTIEAYEGEMEMEGAPRQVAFLRIGRVALIYQTLDGAKSGAWHKAKGGFADLDGDYDGYLRRALRIAKQQAAPDLLVVPLALSPSQKAGQ